MHKHICYHKFSDTKEFFAEAGKTLEESAREYQATHGKKTELQEVEIVTGEEDESNVLQVKDLPHQ